MFLCLWSWALWRGRLTRWTTPSTEACVFEQSRREHLKIDISSLLPDPPVICCNRLRRFTFLEGQFQCLKQIVSKYKLKEWTDDLKHITVCSCVMMMVLNVLRSSLLLSLLTLNQCRQTEEKSVISGFSLPFMLTLCTTLFWFSPDPVCEHWGQTRVQQIPHQGWPPLPLSVHLAVLYRQLQLRYCTPESFIPLPWDVNTPAVFTQTINDCCWHWRSLYSQMFIVIVL